MSEHRRTPERTTRGIVSPLSLAVCAAVWAVWGGAPRFSLAAVAAATPSPAGTATSEHGASGAGLEAWPRVTSPVQKDAQMEARIAELLSHMTLEQKVAQMLQPDIRSVTPADVKRYRLGSVLNGGGAWPGNNKHSTAADWLALADQFYDASMDTSTGAQAIPIFWGTDAVHGHNNVIGATLFPQNIGLGAAHDPQLIEKIGEITALEVAATGIDWTFAPTLAVVRDDRWGRTFESFSEDPQIVKEYAGSMVRGLQGRPGTPAFLDGHHVLATAKHYLGDGGTQAGVDRANNCASEADLLRVHAQGYLSSLEAGVQTVMVSYNSWHGSKMHGNRYLLTDVLRDRLGFDGLVVTDWNGIDEVQGCSVDRCSRAINAGIDLFMVPDNWKSWLQNTVAQVRAGDVPEARIDEAVTRILRVKLRMNLFDKGRPSARVTGDANALIGAKAHREVARRAVRESLVLLKNDGNRLPLRRKLNVLVAGAGADDIGQQSGGWTITWQGNGNVNTDFPGATSIFSGIRQTVESAGGKAVLSTDGRNVSMPNGTKPDVAIVVFGEKPYAEWHGDLRSIDYHATGMVPADVNEMRPAPESDALGRGPECPADIPRQDWASGHAAANGAATASTAPTTPATPATRTTNGAAANFAPEEAAPTNTADLELLQRLKRDGIPVVAVFLTGRPLVVTPELDASDAFVVAWLPGTEGGGIPDVLFRKANGQVNHDFRGKLAFSWPREPSQTELNRGDPGYAPLFPYGFGLSYCKRNCDQPSSREP